MRPPKVLVWVLVSGDLLRAPATIGWETWWDTGMAKAFFVLVYLLEDVSPALSTFPRGWRLLQAAKNRDRPQWECWKTIPSDNADHRSIQNA